MLSSSSYSNSNYNPQKVVAVHDVFLSFSGQDTGKRFTNHLNHGLLGKGMKTFFADDNLERGEAISTGLVKAIKGSRSSIVILSESYAFSRWCLMELHKIVECMDTKGMIVIPIFYHVDPSHVRRPGGSYKDAFNKHARNDRLDKDEVETWRDALKKVGNLAGWTLDENDAEANKIVEIIADITSKLDSKKESPHEPARQRRLQDVPQIANDKSKEKKVINPTVGKGNKEFDALDTGSNALTSLIRHIQVTSSLPFFVLHDPSRYLPSAVFPESKIPSWFTKRSSKPFITVEANTNLLKRKWMGVALCVCFRPYPSNTLSCEMVTLGNLNFQVGIHRCPPSCGQSTSNSFNIWMLYVPIQCEKGFVPYEFKFSFRNTLLDHKSCFGECGVRLVFEEDISDLSFNVSPNESEIWNDGQPTLQNQRPPNLTKSFQNLDISHLLVGGLANTTSPMRGPSQIDSYWSPYTEFGPEYSALEYWSPVGPGMNITIEHEYSYGLGPSSFPNSSRPRKPRNRR